MMAVLCGGVQKTEGDEDSSGRRLEWTKTRADEDSRELGQSRPSALAEYHRPSKKRL